MTSDLSDLFRHIPFLLQIACGGLIVATIIAMVLFLRHIRALTGQMEQVRTTLTQGLPVNGENRIIGLKGEQLEGLRLRAAQLPESLSSWWEKLDSSLEPYTSPQAPDNEDRWFLARPVREILPFDDVVSNGFNVNFYTSFPGLLTGIGLLLTFVAILWGLLGVHFDPTKASQPVTGIDALINGLSGKFASSVVALTLSVVFTVFERLSFPQLRRSYEMMASGISRSIPYLPQTRILLDIQRFAAQQTVSVSNISSEVVDRFVSAFRSEVTPALARDMSSGVAEILQLEFRPTMERMNETLKELRSAIISLESQKQESIAGEMKSLLESVETSIVQALGKMGSDFHTALTGAASQEFGNVQGTLESTRQMLSEMNVQFGAMQAAFSAIVQKAEETTTGQFESGRQQTEALTSLMNGLMTKLQETADQNLSSVRGQLTLVVSDLAERVGGLSEKMLAAAENMTQRSQNSAHEILTQAGSWSESTAHRLEALLGSIEARSVDFQQAGNVLAKTHDQLSRTLSQSHQSLQSMHEASQEVRAYTTALSAQTDALKTISQQHSKVSAHLLDTSGNLRASFDQNGQLLNQYDRVFKDYQKITDALDEGLGGIFDEINSGMRDYSQSVENNFREIVKTSNNVVPEISKLLQLQVAELRDQLEELTSVISKFVEHANHSASVRPSVENVTTPSKIPVVPLKGLA